MRFFRFVLLRAPLSLRLRLSQNVPGTTLFSQDPNAVAESQYAGVELSALKHGKGRNSHIVLVPQPSDDPNDPLNWPRWKKHLTYGVLCVSLPPLNAWQLGLTLSSGLGCTARFFAVLSVLS